MSIVEPSPPPPAPVSGTTPAGERLRVITAGRVGNMEARLGTSGFDVVAVADTEEELVVAVAADGPDAIVVEADLCDSLEHVRELAPDAVLIVVGDRTPAGAIGRIERGVSGTVMAGLLHALVAEGVGAAVVWGLVPALRPPAPAPTHLAGSVLAKAELVRGQVATAVRGHGPILAAAGAVAVSAAAVLVLVVGPQRAHDRVAPPIVTTPVVEPATAGSGSAARAPRGRARPAPVRTDRVGAGSRDGAALGGPSGHEHRPPSDGGPPPTTPPSTKGGSRPPGVAHGWDIRPPKKDDAGNHAGWKKGKGPKDQGPQASGGPKKDPPGRS
jgi:hypothetical protein